MKPEIKVIIKEPDDPFGREATIPNTLKALQEIVGGPIEPICVDPSTFEEPCGGVIIVGNEEAKLKDLPFNLWLSNHDRFNDWVITDFIGGTIIVCGSEGEDFADAPISMHNWLSAMEKERIRRAI